MQEQSQNFFQRSQINHTTESDNYFFANKISSKFKPTLVVFDFEFHRQLSDLRFSHIIDFQRKNFCAATSHDFLTNYA